MLTRRTVIYAGVEGTGYGTISTGTSPLLAWDVDIDIKAEPLKRSALRDTLSNASHVMGMKECTLTFKTEIKGNSAGTVPEMHDLLYGCGFATSAMTGTGVITYALKSAETDVASTTLTTYKDGNRHIIAGARGNVRFNFEAGQYGVAEWEFSGLYSTVSAQTMPDAEGMGDIKPSICYASGFQVGGFSPVCTRMQLDLGNAVVRRDDLNTAHGVKAFRITGREGKMEFDADAVVESSNPFWGDWAGDVVDTYSITLPGNISGVLAASQQRVLISGYFQYETLKYGDADGVSQYECAASLCSSSINSEDDELTINFGYTASA